MLTSHLQNVRLKFDFSAGSSVHDTQQCSHVVITALREQELLNESEGLVSEELEWNHVVRTARTATPSKHV